jgi:glycosyltransferase involved in cell wall biosynthesis
VSITDEVPPLLSVVIPCYNTERYVADAIGTVLDQRVCPLEIIVVDDGSTDGSAAVVRRFAPQVRYICQANGGISRARNRGAELARGTLLAFLDADDLWTPESLSLRLQRLQSGPQVDAVFGGVEQFVSPELRQDANGTFAVPPAMTGRMAGSMLIRRAAFLRVGLFDPAFKVGEMLDWSARADQAGIRMGTIQDIVLRRRIHGANTVLKDGLQSDYLRILRASIARQRAAAGAKL